MPFLSYLAPLLFSFFLLVSPAAAETNFPTAATEISIANVVATKLFPLKYKDVVAVAIETQLPAASVSDPQTYTFQPQYFITEKDNVITLTIDAHPALSGNPGFGPIIGSRILSLTTNTTGQDAFTIVAAYQPQHTKVSVTTVKRKRITGPDNTLVFRTYLVLTFSDTSAPPSKTIVLDPGHGDTDLGATSNELIEKELNLDIALLSRNLFSQQGYEVYMTRTTDTKPSLLDRADAANILQADIFLSIHNNSIPTDMPDAARKLYRGTTALYNAAAPKPAKDLAKLLADELSATLRIHQYPLQDRPNLVVLNSTWVPAVIAEVAMMPHPQDAKMLSQRVYRQQAAQAIFQAVEKYFSLMPLEYRRNF